MSRVCAKNPIRSAITRFQSATRGGSPPTKTRFAMVIRHEVVVMASVHQNCPGRSPTPNTVPVTKAPRLRKKNSGLLIPNNISAMMPT